jgi:hypothetical protein
MLRQLLSLLSGQGDCHPGDRVFGGFSRFALDVRDSFMSIVDQSQRRNAELTLGCIVRATRRKPPSTAFGYHSREVPVTSTGRVTPKQPRDCRSARGTPSSCEDDLSGLVNLLAENMKGECGDVGIEHIP